MVGWSDSALWLSVVATVVAQGVAAIPRVVYPLSSQRPPTARAGHPFSWSFLPGTFNSSDDNSALTYTVTGLPPWVTFSPADRSFVGTPPNSSSPGNTSVEVTAWAANNASSVSSRWQLLLLNGVTAPIVNLPVNVQLGTGAVLGSATYVHYDGGISVPPAWSWSIGLQSDTFTSPSGEPIYYTAYEQGTTRLPPWMSFDTSTATFTGVTPAYQGKVEIVLFGSDRYGYGDVQQSFTFSISQHTLDLLRPLPAINATADGLVNYTVSTASLIVDGAPANASQISDVQVDLSSAPYLTYNAGTKEITGNLPSSVKATGELTLPVIFEVASFNTSISTNLTLRVLPGLFTSNPLPELHVNPGQFISVNLSQYTLGSVATYRLRSVEPHEALNWLTFSNEPLALNGTAPIPTPSYRNVTVAIDATQNNSVVATATLPILLGEPNAEGPGDGSATSNGNSARHTGLSSRAKVILAATLGTVGGLALLIFLLLRCRANFAGRRLDDEVNAAEYMYPGDERKYKGYSVSPGATLVGGTTPKWTPEGAVVVKEGGGPMMAMSTTEATAVAKATGAMRATEEPSTVPRRFDMFSIFTRGPESQQDPSPSQGPAHPPLEGLGINPSDHRAIIQDDIRAFGAPADAEDESYSGHETDQAIRKSAPRGLGLSSDDQRSSWNTTGSSSFFYSDNTGLEDSEGPSFRSEPSRRQLAPSASTTPSRSVPRRRADFQPFASPLNVRNGAMAAFESESSQSSRSVLSRAEPSSGSASGPEIGGIRLISGGATWGQHISDEFTSDMDLAGSESIGTVVTAGFHIISTESQRSASGSSGPRGPNGATLIRPKLIPFNSRRSNQGQRASGRSTQSSALRNVSGDALEDAEGNMVERDIGAENGSSAHSRVYPLHTRGSPSSTASPIFFSTPGERSKRSPACPSNSFGAHLPQDTAKLFDSSAATHSPLLDSTRSRVTCSAEYSLKGTSPRERSATKGCEPLMYIKVAVGEPFHFAPSLNPPPAAQNGSPTQGAIGPQSRYLALQDFSDGGPRHQRQLPEWLHFDARQQELWGIPRPENTGMIPVQIIERRTAALSGSLARGGDLGASPMLPYQEETQAVVARFVLEVVDKRASSSTQGLEHGDIQVVNF